MNDDMNKKIKQVAELLGQEDIPDNVKSLISLLASSGSKEESPSKINTSPSREEKPEKTDLDENVEMVRRVRSMMEKMRSNNDPRVNLLTAIRPFLNDSRQKKVSNIIKLLQMSSVAKFVDEFEK
jgi:hypothetical protein